MEDKSNLNAPLLGDDGSSKQSRTTGNAVEMQEVSGGKKNGAYYPVLNGDGDTNQNNLQNSYNPNVNNNNQMNQMNNMNQMNQVSNANTNNQSYQGGQSTLSNQGMNQGMSNQNMANRTTNQIPYNNTGNQQHNMNNNSNNLTAGQKAINCGGCSLLLGYNPGAYCVSCPVCKATTAVVALNKIGCGRCGKVLLYPSGSNMVQCVCGTVNSTTPATYQAQPNGNSMNNNNNMAGGAYYNQGY